jgi:hypothetical protein
MCSHHLGHAFYELQSTSIFFTAFYIPHIVFAFHATRLCIVFYSVTPTIFQTSHCLAFETLLFGDSEVKTAAKAKHF